MRYRRNRRWRSSVKKHLRALFGLAAETASQEAAMARRYIQVAQRIVMRTRVRLPRHLRYRFCHRCGTFFQFGVNCRVRLRRKGSISSMVITCLECGHRRRRVWSRNEEKQVHRVSKSNTRDK